MPSAAYRHNNAINSSSVNTRDKTLTNVDTILHIEYLAVFTRYAATEGVSALLKCGLLHSPCGATSNCSPENVRILHS